MRNKHYPLYPTEEFHTVRELLDLAAEKYKDKDAYIYKIRKNTYKKTFGEFAKEVHALASFFISEGYSSQRIAILGENSYEWLLTWFAVVISGNTAVPLDKMLSEEQLKFVLSDTGVSLIIYSKQFADFIPAFKDENELLKVLSMENDLGSCLEKGGKALAEKNKTEVEIRPEPSDTAMIIYTSGTTGIAKGVMLSHNNLTFDAMGVSMHLESGGNNLFVLPLNHAYAIIAILVVMNKGKPTCINSGLKRFAQEIKEFKPHEMYLVPLIVENLYDKIMEKAKAEGKLKQLKFLMKLSLFLYSIGIDIRRKLFKPI
ncbi:MAG: acyl--CoA ligase, partial [Clostridiales bacterium]|nr:acyl--CoA ligase [Clostridiales bacterium]